MPPAQHSLTARLEKEYLLSRSFSAWRTGLPYYGPLLVVGVVLAALLPSPWGAYTGGPLLAVGLFVLYFFRDPERAPAGGPADIVSPADGTVVGIEHLEDTPYYDGPCVRISIFLSVFNVHVNRAPANGTVMRVEPREGGYANAMRADSSERNESNAIYLDTPLGPMTIRQISGAVARRIVCVCGPSDRVAKGDRLGMIKFGSRTELYLPRAAQIAVTMRQRVRGNTTVVARQGPTNSHA